MRGVASLEEISSDEDDGDLRDSWRTFAVSASLTPRHGDALTLLRPCRVLGTSSDEQSLWYLALTSRNRDLLHATSQLFIELNARYHLCAAEGEACLAALRDRHAQQLTALLEAANNTKDMIVGSDVTERFVLRHQCELETLQEEVHERSERLAVELRERLFAFLKTCASDVVAACALDCDRRLSTPVLSAAPLSAVHISFFAQQQREWRGGRWRRKRPMVRTVELPNPLQMEIAGLRSSNAAARPVVIDVSPTSALHKCLACLYPRAMLREGDESSEDQEDDDDAEATEEEEGAMHMDDDSDLVSRAVESHLRRLAQRTHAVLFLIGTRAEAEAILAVPATELLLREPDANSPFSQSARAARDFDDRRQCFAPLPDHGHLFLLRTTRHWGANAVLLWTPPRDLSESPAGAPFVADALRLAHAWGADMFAVAVLGTAHARAKSADVLRQLQRGIARGADGADGAANAAAVDPRVASRDDEPSAAEAPPMAFDAMNVRAFLPLRFAPRGGSGGGGATPRRGRGMSFSSEDGARAADKEGSGARQMSLEKLLVYTFGDSVVVH